MTLRSEYQGQMWNFVFGGIVFTAYLAMLWFVLMLPDKRMCP